MVAVLEITGIEPPWCRPQSVQWPSRAVKTGSAFRITKGVLGKSDGTPLTSTKCTVIVSVQSRGAEGSGPRSTGTDNGGRCCGASTGNRVGNQGRTGEAHALRGDVRQA